MEFSWSGGVLLEAFFASLGTPATPYIDSIWSPKFWSPSEVHLEFTWSPPGVQVAYEELVPTEIKKIF